jgi:hypothetical protein
METFPEGRMENEEMAHSIAWTGHRLQRGPADRAVVRRLCPREVQRASGLRFERTCSSIWSAAVPMLRYCLI